MSWVRDLSDSELVDQLRAATEERRAHAAYLDLAALLSEAAKRLDRYTCTE